MEELVYTTRKELDDINKSSGRAVHFHVCCASMLLPELLLYLKKSDPSIEFDIHQWNTPMEQMKEGIWLIADHFREEDMVLLEECFNIAIPKSHPLATKEKIYLKDLEEENFIMLADQWQLSNLVRQEWEKRGFEPKIGITLDNPNLMRELLWAQQGFAFIPEITWHLSENAKIVMKQVEDCSFSRKIYLHTPEQYLSKEEKYCVERIRSFFGALK